MSINMCRFLSPVWKCTDEIDLYQDWLGCIVHILHWVVAELIPRNMQGLAGRLLAGCRIPNANHFATVFSDFLTNCIISTMKCWFPCCFLILSCVMPASILLWPPSYGGSWQKHPAGTIIVYSGWLLSLYHMIDSLGGWLSNQLLQL